jgi:hypothetical protein
MYGTLLFVRDSKSQLQATISTDDLPNQEDIEDPTAFTSPSSDRFMKSLTKPLKIKMYQALL